MTTALLIILAIVAGLGIKWLVNAKEEFFEIFTIDENKD